MPKMKEKDIREKAVEIAIEALRNGTFMDKAENAGQKTLAYPVYLDINGDGTEQEIWVTAEFVTKMWRPYNVRGTEYPPYNPFEVEADWQRTLAVREQKAKEIAEKKAKKLAKQNKVKAEG